MKLSEILTRAAAIIGLDDVSVSVPSVTLTKLTDCANTVYSELVLEHIPLKNKEDITFTGGKAFYSDFRYRVREVLSVKVRGVKTPFVMYPTYVESEGAEGSAEVEYLFHPGTLEADDEVILPPQFSEYVMAIGVASEYYYRLGYIEEAEFYKARFDNAVYNLSRRLKSFRIPPRRFV